MGHRVNRYVVAGLAIVAALCLFPPRLLPDGINLPEEPSRGFLFYGVNSAEIPTAWSETNGHRKVVGRTEARCRVDIGRLLAEILFVMSATFVLGTLDSGLTPERKSTPANDDD